MNVTTQIMVKLWVSLDEEHECLSDALEAGVTKAELLDRVLSKATINKGYDIIDVSSTVQGVFEND
jgi:hypothetical protein